MTEDGNSSSQFLTRTICVDKAVMELGASICTIHRPPSCITCPIQNYCLAYKGEAAQGQDVQQKQRRVTDYPVKVLLLRPVHQILLHFMWVKRVCFQLQPLLQTALHRVLNGAQATNVQQKIESIWLLDYLSNDHSAILKRNHCVRASLNDEIIC